MTRFTVLLLWIVGCLACACVASAAPADENSEQEVFARYSSGKWQAAAAFYGPDYGPDPRYECQLSTAGATLTQGRPAESSIMDVQWFLLQDEEPRRDNLTIDWVQVGGKKYEVASLPWRLLRPTASAIILPYDISLLVVRRDNRAQWLPFAYLALEMFGEDSFEIGYHYDGDDDKRVSARRTISLNGFREASKWCGRQLLRDRIDEERANELTR